MQFECNNATVREELQLLLNYYEISSFKVLEEKEAAGESYVVQMLLPVYSEVPEEDKYWWAKMEAELIIPSSFPIDNPRLKIASEIILYRRGVYKCTFAHFRLRVIWRKITRP
jgi:hypothetical protein